MERKREIGPFNLGSRVERQGMLAEFWGGDLLAVALPSGTGTRRTTAAIAITHDECVNWTRLRVDSRSWSLE